MVTFAQALASCRHVSACSAHLLCFVWQINPYEPEVNWFSDDKEIMPLSAAPEPKRRFIPSKWEEKKYAL